MQGSNVQEALQMFSDAVNELTYDDFVYSDFPYQLLEEASTSPESRVRFELILKRRAKELKIPAKTIDEILKSRANNIVQFVPKAEAMTAWDGQPIALRCGRYETADGRISYETKWGVEQVCSHPIMPTKRYINIDAETESLEISFRREGWRSIIIDRGTLSNSTTIIQLANHGVSVTSETAKELVKYIAYIDDLNRDLIPIERTSAHLGWINGHGFVPYVDGVKYDAQGQFAQMYKTIEEHGDYSAWLDAVRNVRQNGTVQARIAIAASFASVLLSRFDALPFFVHLWSSQSGTGKTVTMEVAASVWANPQVGAYCRPLKSTNVGLEQLAVFTCNLPLCLDELQSIQDKRNFDDIIYSLCEGSGKTRGSKNGGLRYSPTWKNAIITTGEMPIVGSASKAGAMNRVIELECDGAIIPDAKKVHRTISANYGHAGREFIDALADKETEDQIEAEQQELFETLSVVGTDKQALSASILLVADHLAERVIFKDGVTLTADDVLPYLRTQDDVDTGKRMHEYLLEWIAENKNGFIIDGNLETFKGHSVFGCIDTDGAGNVQHVWIINKAFLTAMADGNFSADSYLSWAYGQKLLKTKDASKKIVKRIPGVGILARCVCISFEAKKPEDNQLDWVFAQSEQDLPF